MPSHCVECNAEMPDAEARRYLECYDCQCRLKRRTPIRDLNMDGTEEVGRPTLNWETTGGNPFYEEIQ